MLHRLWKHLKVARRLNFGPASVVFRFERAVRLRTAPRNLPAVENQAPVTELAHARAGPLGAERGTVSQSVSAKPEPETALIVGAGPGLGESLARRLASEGINIALASRDGVRLERLAGELRRGGVRASGFTCDVTDELSVQELFQTVCREYGVPHLVVYALQSFGPGRTVDIEVPAFEAGWRHNCFGAFLVARAAARLMAAAGRGTIVLVGSTSAMIGRENHLNLAAGKFGQRALAQVLAREMWSHGVHVVHVVIDADIRGDIPEEFPQAQPEDLAETICFLHRQPRTAWTSEIDLRPWNERFWEHC
jgi:NAD(P)-dependent dehydrogenase (short-subunit alcohol dehydrogenase family)